MKRKVNYQQMNKCIQRLQEKQKPDFPCTNHMHKRRLLKICIACQSDQAERRINRDQSFDSGLKYT